MYSDNTGYTSPNDFVYILAVLKHTANPDRHLTLDHMSEGWDANVTFGSLPSQLTSSRMRRIEFGRIVCSRVRSHEQT